MVSYALREGFARVVIDNPPVNALSRDVRQGLLDAIEQAEEDDALFLLLECAGKTFIAGADIREIGRTPEAPILPDVVARIDQSVVPVVAAMQGSALGGGLEIALACHYRIALADTHLGLPEVKLGIIPGAGGTQRLPRLIGIQEALQMISTGRPVDALRGLKLGLVDAVLAPDLDETAIDWCRQHVVGQVSHPRISSRALRPSTEDLAAMTAQRKKAGRYPQVLAPTNLCDAIEAAYRLNFPEGLTRERALFTECRDSPQSAAMRHLFFAERRSSRLEGVSTSDADEILSTAVVGGGTMGRGIAINLLDAGRSVKLLEVDKASAHKTGIAITSHYESAVRRGRMSNQLCKQRLAAIEFVTEYADLGDTDLIIEAVFEDIGVKQQVFRELDKVCKPGTILASNTSYQDIDQLAAVTNRPEAVLGMHYFSPANVMKLLEVVRGTATADDVLASALKLGKACNKVPVISGVCYGFIGNRINRRLQQQAQLCLLEGATPKDIDNAMEQFGMAMGPLAVSDLAGLDIGYMARKALNSEQKGDPRTYWIPDALVELGRLGQKSGSGYYLYGLGDRKRQNDPVVMELIQAASERFGYRRSRLDKDEIVERLLLSVVNEASTALEEGIAARASDIDVVYVHGYGFPAHRGGVMYWAERLGLAKVLEKLNHYHEKSGDKNLRPTALIAELAASGEGFSALAPGSR